MTPEDYKEGLDRAAVFQRAVGWSEDSIRLYREDHEKMTEAMGGPQHLLMVGAGLAQDNSRFGVH
ncbi:hypothetical protein [Stenotrophomonas phage BUCT608]|nr:hypothetical protein [Stenotrophomonas phage BUCT608]QYC97489.1 hypothetical protein [Stenotrophomonas phage BUCT608]